MEKLDFKQIMSVLQEKLERVDDFAYGDYNDGDLGLGEIKSIPEASTGGEGKGEDWCRVFHFTEHDVYIAVSGYYSSYNGTDFQGWDDCSEVRPQQRMVTLYESI